MRIRVLTLLMTIVVAGVILAQQAGEHAPKHLAAQADQSLVATRWEYKCLDIFAVQSQDPEKYNLEAGLDTLGADGWELVHVTDGHPNSASLAAAEEDRRAAVSYTLRPLFFFKRPQSE